MKIYYYITIALTCLFTVVMLGTIAFGIIA